MNEFESAKLLVGRAKENYADFTNRRNAFFKSRRIFHFIENDPDTGDAVHKIRFVGEVPGELRTTASDTLNNLRHALDHAIFASRKVLNPKASRKTYFPIGENESSFNGEVKRKCDGVHQGIVEVVRSFRPFNGGDELLWGMCKIAGPNKHQILLGVDLAIEPISQHIQVAVGDGQYGGCIRCGDANEWEIARMAPDSIIKFEYRTITYITFAEGEIIKDQVVSRLLDEHINKVEQIVLKIEQQTAAINAR